MDKFELVTKWGRFHV